MREVLLVCASSASWMSAETGLTGLWFLFIPSALLLLSLQLLAALRANIIRTDLRLAFAGFQTRRLLVLEEHRAPPVFTPEESGPVSLDLLAAHLAEYSRWNRAHFRAPEF